MIVIIQCAGKKRRDAGSFRTSDGRKVLFVADPAAAPPSQDLAYARPDDWAANGMTWREKLLEYNRAPDGNPLGLLPAGELYVNPVYGRLVGRFGSDRTYILSAGWGLIAASFLTPNYDITFSATKPQDRYKRRKKSDLYRDFRMLPDGVDDTVVLFVSDKYVPLFSALASGFKGNRIVFYSAGIPPQVAGCTLQKFSGTQSTNWQYDCANAFLNGTIRIPATEFE